VEVVRTFRSAVRESKTGPPQIRPSYSICPLRSALLLSLLSAVSLPLFGADVAPVVDVLIGIERLLLRTQLIRDMLQIDPDACPRLKAAPHRITRGHTVAGVEQHH